MSSLGADSQRTAVWAFDPKTAKLTRVAAGLDKPSGLTTDKDGRVYIREGSGQVIVFDSPRLDTKPRLLPARLYDATQVNKPTASFLTDPECLLLARLLYGEATRFSAAKGILLSRDALEAIGWSARNRTGKNRPWGNTLHGVLLNPGQYEIFSVMSKVAGDVKNPATSNPTLWQESVSIAERVLTGPTKVPVRGATHYSWDGASQQVPDRKSTRLN